MAAKIEKEKSGLLILKISGKLLHKEFSACQKAAADLIQTAGSAKVLALISDFQGWEKTRAWGDITFMTAFGDRIEKMALVGDLKWKEEALMFVGAPIRKTKIEFFESSQEPAARSWLNV